MRACLCACVSQLVSGWVGGEWVDRGMSQNE